MGLELPQDFKEFLNLLRANGVEYLLIGAYAVGYHGYPRATRDMDIWIAATPENADRMVKTLREFGFDTPQLTTELLLRSNNILRMGEEPMRIEIMNSASGVEFEECYAQKVTDMLDGVLVNLISLNHLKTNKKASGRLKDLSDVEHLP
jgi:phage replication-related protein YjqB (UPF0714/DUF867 family)